MNRIGSIVVACLMTAVSAPWIAEEKNAVDLGAIFEGSWKMQGKFRYAPDADWIPTGSELVAESKLNSQVMFREIEAPQINFSAIDIITYNANTGVAQYIYINSQDTSALYYDGSCEENCRVMKFKQVCGPAWKHSSCEGTTEIRFESDSKFVARDFRPGDDGKPFMTREVYYTRH